MTPKQILDSFSATLMEDERILSAQERELLAKVLSQARNAAVENPEMQEAVQRVIATAVGETVAQRAFSVLGASIVDSILETSTLTVSDAETLGAKKTPAKKTAPSPAVRSNPVSPSPGAPSPGPQGPQANPLTPTRPLNAPTSPTSPSGPQGPQSNPLTPTRPLDAPVSPTSPPSPKGPQGPQGSIEKVVKSETAVSAQDRPAHLKARCVVLDEFLAPQEVEQLTQFALEQEERFRTSEVISPVSEGGVVDYEHRRSRVLMESAPYQDLVLKRIKAVLPEVLEQLDMEQFTISGEEVQITASNDGDFFRFHSDNGNEGVTSRYLTFVYFFHREPRPFDGGELHIHDARLEDGQYVSEGSYQVIAPQQNQIVFFPCELLHEITPVNCPSGQFADSRFTVNGWLRR
jgi:Rps23 Pro-64 3,4-dihydroxylase Tpa1-like proline 4-hydroxylase